MSYPYNKRGDNKKSSKGNNNQQNYQGHGASGGGNTGMSYQPRPHASSGNASAGGGQQLQQPHQQYSQKQKPGNFSTESPASISANQKTGAGAKASAASSQLEGFSHRGGSQWGSGGGGGQAASSGENEALEKAARSGQDELLAQVLDGFSMNAKQVNQRQLNTALHAAVEGCNSTASVENHVSCIHHLLAVGAQVNAEKKGKTILMIAATKGFIELVTEILSKDAWVNHGDSDSRTALHYAIDNKAENLDVVSLLIEKNADFNKETTSDGFTPLIIAVKRGHKNIAKTLIDMGAKLDAMEYNQNNTALHIACQAGEKEIVEMLATERTFDQIFTKENKNGQTAIQVSEDKVMEVQQEMLMSGTSPGTMGGGGINSGANQFRGQQKNQGQTNEKDKAAPENRHWDTYDHLDNLRQLIEEKAKKAGDNLISEEMKRDEQRRTKKIEKQQILEREQREKEQKEKEQQEQEALENQQKAIAQAKSLEKQILNNERANQSKASKKERNKAAGAAEASSNKTSEKPKSDQAQTQKQKNDHENVQHLDAKQSEDKNQGQPTGSQKSSGISPAGPGDSAEKGNSPQVAPGRGAQQKPAQNSHQPHQQQKQQNRNNSSPSGTQRAAGQNSNQGTPYGSSREARNANNSTNAQSQLQNTSQRGQNQGSGNKNNQKQSSSNQNENVSSSQNVNGNQLAPLVNQMMPSQQQQEQNSNGGGSSSQPPPPAASQQTQQPQPPPPQFLVPQQAPHGGQLGVPGLTQQDFLNQALVGSVPQQQYGGMNLGGNLAGGLPQLDPNPLNAGLPHLALGGMNGMNGLNLGQVLPQQTPSPVDLQNLQNSSAAAQQFNSMNQSQQFNSSIAGPGGASHGLQPNLQNQQFAQQLNNLSLNANGTGGQNGVSAASLPNALGQLINQPQPQQQPFQPLNQNVSQNNMQQSLQALQNQHPLQNFVAQHQNTQALQNSQQNQNGNNSLGQGSLTQSSQPQMTNNNTGTTNPQDTQPQTFQHQESAAKSGLNGISLPVVPGMQPASVAPNSSLPIRVSLDFSDEKSQNLFIFEQKYNMKKNDCFNLEKQKMALQQQLTQKNDEFETLKASYQALQQKVDELQQAQASETNGSGSNSATAQSTLLKTQKLHEKTIADLEEAHNEQLTMINHYKQMSEEKTKFSLEVINKSMLAVDLIRKYKDDGSNTGKAAAGANAATASGSGHPTKKEVDDVEKKIIQCQEAIQKDLIPTDPGSMVRNPLSLKFLKKGSTQALVANSTNLGTRPDSSSGMSTNLPLPNQSSQNYENQASNILEMERRYETPLKQQPLPPSSAAGGATRALGGQLLVQTGHGVQLVPPAAHGGQNLTGQSTTMVPPAPQLLQVHTRHNFYEIQNILHNEILLFKQDANAILHEMQEVKTTLIARLTQIVTKVFPSYFVDLFGSHATGLCLHWSDIDLVVGPKSNPDNEKEQSLNLNLQEAKIKDALRRVSTLLNAEMANHWITHVHYIEQAAVPIVKVQCSLSALMDSAGLKYPKNQKYASIYNDRFSIDITHMTEFHNGIKCVDLVKEYLLDCWFIEPLILVLKQMLKVNGLNDPYKGGLSSYGLLLMIVAFIQFRKLNKVRIPQNINLGNILLDFLHYYGEILQYHEYGIMCRKPGDVSESSNFYNLIPEITMYQANKVPCIDDPLNPQNNVGKSTFQFQDIQKIFKVGYQSAFLGCFCDCHFSHHKQPADQALSGPDNSSGSMSLRSLPFVQGQRSHPVYSPAPGEQVPPILYQDEQGQLRSIEIDSLYLQERIAAQEKCDSILTKIIYSQAQFKAAEENAM